MKTPHLHIDTERMQALLDGELSPAEAAEVRAEIEACVRCSAEFEAWELLFGDLESLPALAPSDHFRERVLAHLPDEGRGFLGARAAAREISRHLEDDVIQGYLDGRLAARAASRANRHLDGCAICRGEMEGYRQVARALEGLPELTPSTGFAEAVLAEVRIRELAAVAMAPTTAPGRIVAWLRAHAPSSRQGWAAVFGASVAPVFTLLLLIRSIFSHELVTLGNLATFVRLRSSGVVTWLGTIAEEAVAIAADRWIPGFVLESLTRIGSSPTLLGTSAGLAAVVMVASVWILHRNLRTAPLHRLSDAHLSF
ncbi:MAG: zf-HC2 domain-containing protein [Longimicrobiales bacterium]|nr:zf-HC2 domain-containing protein [Longimicrobiales bacterium]